MYIYIDSHTRLFRETCMCNTQRNRHTKQVPFAAKAFEIIVHTIAREDQEEEEEDSWDSGEGDAESSDGDESGDQSSSKGMHGSCEADEGTSSNRPMAGMLAGGRSLVSKPPFMGTEQFEARQKEMVKSIMAGIHRYVCVLAHNQSDPSLPEQPGFKLIHARFYVGLRARISRWERMNTTCMAPAFQALELCTYEC